MQVVRTVAALAVLAVGAFPSATGAGERVVAAHPPVVDSFQVVVVRGSSVSLVTGGGDGVTSEVTIRPDSRPPSSETDGTDAEAPPRQSWVKEQPSSTTYYVFFGGSYSSYPVNFAVGFLPVHKDDPLQLRHGLHPHSLGRPDSRPQVHRSRVRGFTRRP